MSADRFDLGTVHLCGQNPRGAMKADPEGRWVSYDDYAVLLAERDAARALADELDFLHHEGGEESIAREIERARDAAFAAGQRDMQERCAQDVAEFGRLFLGNGDDVTADVIHDIRALPVKDMPE